jgi:toxin YoeB
MYEIRYTKQTAKDIINLVQAKLDGKVKNLIEIIRINPYETPPPFDKIVGDLTGAYSRRINRQHRMIYKIDEEHHAVILIRLWTHYE